jgi:hypothetical protein
MSELMTRQEVADYLWVFEIAGAGGGMRKDCKRRCGFGREENLEEQS